MQRVKAFLLRRGPLGGDGLLGLAFAVIGALEFLMSRHIEGPLWANAITPIVIGATLAVRRSHPAVAAPALLTWVAVQEFANGDLVENSLSAMVALPLVSYSMGALCDRRRAIVALTVALAGGWAASIHQSQEIAGTILFIAIIVGGPWLLGRIVNARSRLAAELAEKNVRLEHEKEQEAKLAVAEERARIARELHDVVAHNVSVMVVQTAAARRTLERDPARARIALHSVESTGREALTEMRQMLGMLRKGDEDLALSPQPGISQLDSLVQRAREAGVDVEVEFAGDRRRLQQSVDLSAFRIVQEALTNTIKHAGPTRARVRIAYGEDEVELQVTDDGRGVVARPADGMSGGHGLVGMRERVAMLGGELHAGYLKEGGFGVRARIPLTERGA